MQNSNHNDNANPDSAIAEKDLDKREIQGNTDTRNNTEEFDPLLFMNTTPISDMSPDQLRSLEEVLKKERKNKAEKVLIERWREFVASVNDTDMTLQEALEVCNPSLAKGGKKISKIRYRNPENPLVGWTGRGRKPEWFITCTENGVDPKEMEV